MVSMPKIVFQLLRIPNQPFLIIPSCTLQHDDAVMLKNCCSHGNDRGYYNEHTAAFVVAW